METLSPPWSSVSTEPPSNASLASLTFLLVKWGAGTEPHLLGPLISHLLTGRGDRVHFVLSRLYSPGQAPPLLALGEERVQVPVKCYPRL